jgi:hypothetical protein
MKNQAKLLINTDIIYRLYNKFNGVFTDME